MQNGNGHTDNTHFTEAPASVTMKISYRGFDDILFTLRAGSGLELLAKLDPAIDKLEAMGATPSRRNNGGRANGATAAPATNGNGNGSEHVCPTHTEVKMLTSKHRPNELYCPERISDTGGGSDGSKPIYCKAKIKL